MNTVTTERNARGLVVRCVYIPRHHYGFGFTLRHFIVYPPELYANDGSSGESNAQPRIGQVTEPVDTIFVKSVREHGPAARAGLCVGDRVVSVNGETIAGKSYDQVVHLIQRSPSTLCLEVTPKQYDTLQLFYEEKAYRPETNQRPSAAAPPASGGANGLGLNSISILVNQNNQSSAETYQFYHNNYHLPPSLQSVTQQLQNNQNHHSLHQQRQQNQAQALYSLPSYNSSYESVFLPNFDPSLNTVGNMSSSSTYTNSQQQDQAKHNQIQQQQLFSHLPRPTPYKSTVVWSHLTPSQQQQHQLEQQQKIASKQYNSGKSHQPQTYYPFNQGSGGTNPAHRGIRDDAGNSGAKSHESVLAVTTDATDNCNRYGSMECLPSGGNNSVRVGGSNFPGGSEVSGPGGGNPWKMIPGYRYSISTGPSDVDLRRESTISLPPSSAMVPSYQTSQQPPSGGRTVIASGHPSNATMIDASGTYSLDAGDIDHSSLGYEGKMVDRIRRSCEQKEEFLKRPNQPLVWAPITPNSAAAAGFPKELYAQPQKFQKVPWPPANVNPGYGLQQSMSTPTASSICNQGNINVSRASSASEPFRYADISPSHRKMAESGDSGIGSRGPNRPTDWAEYGIAKNRLTVVGSGKLHCDPPPGWKPPPVIVHPSSSSVAPSGSHEASTIPKSNGTTTSNDETEYYVQNRNDTDVILRKRENDPDFDNDRVVRRVSYLKATSSPIDMERKSSKSSSPTTPTKSPSAEFRHFGSFRTEKSPDDSEIIKDGPIHFKVRAGENKKVGYYRSWRQGWAQIRRSGCLYLSKERITKESISGMEENAAILCVGLKDGISIEAAEDYSKRKYVLRLKTSSATTPNGGGVGVPNVTLMTSPAESINASLLPHVEILIQADDHGEMNQWLKSLQQQQDNNNYFCATKPQNNSNSSAVGTATSTNINSSSNSSTEFSQKSSLFKSLLPSQGGFHSTATSSSSTPNTFLSVNSAGVLVSNPTSPKTKTWKGKVAKQWKRMQHLSTSSPGSSHHGSGYNPQGPIPETGASFGVMLDDCPVGENNPAIPRVMEICVNTIETRGLGITGIYRIPGNSAAVAALTDSLNKGNEPNPELDPRWNDVHVISSMLKSFLRNLPDPLLTSDRYQDFIRGVYDAEEEVQFERIKALIDDLPEINYETLRYLILHLKKVSENSERNRMESRNLAIVFGPTLVRTADDSVASMVNDMKQQCKLVELLINLAYQFFPPHSQNSPPAGHPASEIQGISVSGPVISDPKAKFESDIRASLIQAAQRKVSRQHLQPTHNTYGLPMASSSSNPNERGAVDESGLIRSYAGLGAETEQRVRQFEMETRAMLTRDSRSPNPASNSSNTFCNSVTGSSSQSSSGVKHSQLGVSKGTQNQPEDAERIRLEKLRLEAEWRKAKDDLENEDFYDQLADNPSSIVHHKEHGLPPFPLLSHNVSSSSVSSSNSAGGNTADGNEALSSGVISPSMSVLTWPMKLGPTPFKPSYPASSMAVPSLPPKPPHVTLNSSSSSSSSTTTKLTKVLTVSNPSSFVGNPLRKVSSVEHLTSTGGTKIRDGFMVANDRFDSSKVTGRETLTRLKKSEVKPAVPYDPKIFGSLDSLRDIVNGGSKEDLSPRSSDGSDLVASMCRALDQKLSSLRPSITLTGHRDTEQQGHSENDTIKQEPAEGENAIQFSEVDLSGPASISDGEDSLSLLLNSTKSNGINKGRSRSLIERRKDLDEEEVEKVAEPIDRNYVLLKLSYQNPSLHRVSNIGNGSAWSGDKPGENGEDRLQSSPMSSESQEHMVSSRTQHQRQPSASLTKEAKTASNNRLTKESQRRHSLSGTADILRFVLEDHKLTGRLSGHASSGGHGNHGKNVSTDTLATALAANNILESHV